MDLISRQEAREQGLKRYFTGKPCKHGHISERLVSNKSCCACHTGRNNSPAGKAAKSAYANSPAGKAAKSAYANSPAGKAAATAYANSPERKAAMAAYNNSLKAKAAKAAWSAANKNRRSAYMAAYAKENPAARAAICAQRRAAKLQATPKWADRSAIKAIYEHAAFMTRVCNEPFHVDHFYPLQGEKVSGLHVPANLRIITAAENIRKSNRYDPSH